MRDLNVINYTIVAAIETFLFCTIVICQ